MPGELRDCVPPDPAVPHTLLTEDEKSRLFGAAPDATLIGSRLAALFSAIGVPPCESCLQRAEWLDNAHGWLREVYGIPV
jgi:hypothetical protein